MRISLLPRGIVALAALAILAVPMGRPMHAFAGQGGRALPVTVCSSAGIPAEAPLPDRSPSDRGTGGACQTCALCAGGADRLHAGPVPAGIPVPASPATQERPAARPHAGPASGPGRVSRARDPPPAS